MTEGREGAAAWLEPGERLKWSFILVNVFRMLKLIGPLAMIRLAISGNKTERLHPEASHYDTISLPLVPAVSFKARAWGLP